MTLRNDDRSARGYGSDTAAVKIRQLPGETVSSLLFDGDKIEILLDAREPEITQHGLLLGRVITLAEKLMFMHGQTPHSQSESQVDTMALLLLCLLTKSGLWNGVSSEQVRAFLDAGD